MGRNEADPQELQTLRACLREKEADQDRELQLRACALSASPERPGDPLQAALRTAGQEPTSSGSSPRRRHQQSELSAYPLWSRVQATGRMTLNSVPSPTELLTSIFP